MKKSILYLMCAVALMGLGACGEEVVAPDVVDPAPETPGSEGMVTINLNASDGGYRDGAPEATRANGGQPVRFTHDLGNGLVMESELVPGAVTRADMALAEGTSILMVAYDPAGAVSDADKGYPVVGYEVITVGADGKLPITLPSTGEFYLMFFSENSSTAINPATYLDETDGSVARTYYPIDTSCSVILVDYLTDGNKTGVPPDFIYARLEDGPYTAVELAASTDPVIFRHVATELAWTLIAGNSFDNNETLGDLSVGIYPRWGEYSGATVGDAEAVHLALGSLSSTTANPATEVVGLKMPIATYLTWEDYEGSAYDNDQSNIMFERTGTTVGTADYSNSARFISSDTKGSPEVAAPAGFVINSMTFKTDDVDLSISNKDLPIYTGTSGDSQLYFERGCKYTIKSKVSKKPSTPSPSSVIFAVSNIYWDGSKLTFDTEPDQAGTNWAKQGVYFKWGSLVGIAPTVGTEWKNGSSVTLYVPDYDLIDASTSTWDSGSAKDYGWSWTEIPVEMTPSTFYIYDAAYNTDAKYSAHLGDICKYLSATGAAPAGYRMPTKADFVGVGPWTYDGANVFSGTPNAAGTTLILPSQHATNGTTSITAWGHWYMNLSGSDGEYNSGVSELWLAYAEPANPALSPPWNTYLRGETMAVNLLNSDDEYVERKLNHFRNEITLPIRCVKDVVAE